MQKWTLFTFSSLCACMPNRPIMEEITLPPRPVIITKKTDQFIYKKKHRLRIGKAPEIRGPGSLYSDASERNFLFATNDILELGEIVHLKILASYAKPAEKSPTKNEAKKDEAPNPELSTEEAQLLDDLLKNAPSELKQRKTMRPMLSLPMKVVHQFASGDLLLRYERTSISHLDGKSIEIEARLPHDRIYKKKDLTTKDIEDIEFFESYEQERGSEIFRSSLVWEDEYALRLAGFTEATSVEAQNLVNKESSLKEMAGKLEQKSRSIARERQTMVKERDALIVKQKADQERIDGLETKMSEVAPEALDELNETEASNLSGEPGAAKPKAEPKKAPEAKAAPTKAEEKKL